jgi:hypothetical protein
MSHIANRSRGVAAITPFILSLACLWLGACGGSSTSSTTNTTAAVASTPAATTASTPPPSTTTPAATTSTVAESGPPTAADKRRRQIALRVVKCFHANGINLPAPNPQGYITIRSTAGTRPFKTVLLKCKPVLNEAAGLSGKK